MRVLIAEDDAIFRRILESTLGKWGYEVVAAVDGGEAWSILQSPASPKLVVLDWMMPGLDGVEICRRVRQEQTKPYTYILLLTAKGKREDLITALEAGADDFVVKPFNPLELKGRLRAGARILDLQDELLAAREELHYLATHDSLTGLWNRSAVLDQLNRALARSERQRVPLAVAIADVDHFKTVNDTYGHSIGDAVLREIAARMTASVRPYDTVGRYGGEEFLIIFEGCNAPEAIQLAERLCSRVSLEQIRVGDVSLSGTISLGIATVPTATPGIADALIRTADVGLYAAKRRGRNCVAAAALQESSDRPDLCLSYTSNTTQKN